MCAIIYFLVESNELRSHCDAPDDPVVEESDESICLAAIDAALNKASIARLKRSELTIPISSSAINSVSVNEESKSLSSKKPSSTTRSKLVKHLPEEATLPTSRNNEKYRAFQRPAIASRRIPLQDVKSLRNRCLGLGNLGSKQRVHPQEPAFRLPCISSDHKNPSPTELPATNSAHVCAAASFARADICTTNLEPSSSVTNRSQSVGPSHIPPSLSAPQHRSNSNADIAAGLCCTQDRTRAASRSQTQSLRSRSASTRERVSTLYGNGYDTYSYLQRVFLELLF